MSKNTGGMGSSLGPKKMVNATGSGDKTPISFHGITVKNTKGIMETGRLIVRGKK